VSGAPGAWPERPPSGAPAASLAERVVAEARRLGFHRAALVPIDPPVPMQRYREWLDAGYAGEMDYLSSPEHLALRAEPRGLLAEARSMLVVALAHQRHDPPDDPPHAPPEHRRDTVPDATTDADTDADTDANTDATDLVDATEAAVHPAPAAAPPPGDFVPLRRLRGRIARYARSEDYHMVLRDRLVLLAERLRELLGRPVLARSCVDAAPVLERAWAERAGLGFIAKNTMLIAPGLGSHVMLGELLLDLELPPISAEATGADAAPAGPAAAPRRRCGGCRACLDACPTQAFVDAYVLDARRCISYLTIEHRGVIPRHLRAAIGSWIFGCDVCQDVCPFNAGGGEPHDPALAARDLEHALPDLLVLAGHHTNQLRRFVKRTSMRRISREQLLRNVAIALGNSDDVRAVAALVPLVAHRAPLVRGHAAWALGRLQRFPGARPALEERLALEEDPGVAEELRAALDETPAAAPA
jgi:epoxyqueuosine reductase